MRTQRRKRRVEDLEWFDALYRVYLAAFLGGGAIMFLSGLVGDAPIEGQQFTNLVTHVPHGVGLVSAMVVLLGLRSGAHGGPVAVEEAEVRHVLMSPVPRSHALRTPALQRVRTFAFVGAIAGGIANQLLARRLPDASTPMIGFVACGAVAGALIGSLFVVAALVAHELGIRQWLATAIGSTVVAAQAFVTVTEAQVPGPFDFVGSISMWWHRVHPFDAIGIAIIVALAVWSVANVGSLSLESLARRSALVTQMKFAVTLQDVRTVVLLRRALSQEHMRSAPWVSLPRRMGGDVVVVRGVRSIMRFPLRRLARMAGLTVCAAVAMVVAWNGTTPAVVVAGLCMFVVGLDAVEALSQEIDQPNRTDSFPRERGWLLTRHLIVPSGAMVPFVVIGTATAFVARPEPSTIGYGVLMAVSVAAGAVLGAALNSVNGAPDQAGSATAGLALPPEMAGMGTVIRGAIPPAVTIISCLPLLAFRESVATGNELANGLRAIGAVAIVLMLAGGWVRQRDAIRDWFATASNEATKKSSATPTVSHATASHSTSEGSSS